VREQGFPQIVYLRCRLLATTQQASPAVCESSTTTAIGMVGVGSIGDRIGYLYIDRHFSLPLPCVKVEDIR
jgi:hypothetical protein